MDKFNYGENLRKIRQSKGISQDAMAYHLKISQKTYSRIEHQVTIADKNQVHDTARILGVEPAELLPHSEEVDLNVKPSTPTSTWEHKAKEIINIPRIGTALILTISATLLPAAYGLAQGVCLYIDRLMKR